MMSTREAVKILKDQGYFVDKVNGIFYIKYPTMTSEAMSAREVIKIAKIYTSEGQRNNIKKNVKQQRHERNRAKTRQLIEKEEFDAFYYNKLAKDDDIWNWD